MDGWNTIVSSWDGQFSGARLVSGSVSFSLASKFSVFFNTNAFHKEAHI